MRRRGWRRPVGILAAAAALSVSFPAVRPLAQQQPMFRAGVEVVAIDVNVVDASGRPIEGLRPEDFVVTVDRKARPIVSATYIRHAVARVSGDRRTPSTVLDALAAGTERVPRNILIVVDEDTIEPGFGLAAMRAARAFVDALPAGDRVAVVTIPRLPSALRLDSDRAANHRALSGVATHVPRDNPGEYRIGLQEAYDIERGDGSTTKRVIDRECKCDYQPGSSMDPRSMTPIARSESRPCDQTCAAAVAAEAKQVALHAHLRTQRSLDALRELANGLSKIEGPKTVVLVSGGLGVPETPTSFDPLEPAMAAGQMSLYAIHVEQSAFGQVKVALSPTAVEDERLEVYGLENLTSATGGTLIPAVGSIEGAFDRVTTEMAGSYLLGVDVAAGDRDGKAHLVDVKVKRAQAAVRSRKWYLIAPEKRTAPEAAPVAPPRALRRADVPSRVGEMDAVTPELVALLTRASEHVGALRSAVPAMACEEQYEQALSQWKSGAVVVNGVSRSTEDWFLDKRRRIRSEFVLALAPGQEASGWHAYRDVLDVDGVVVRPSGRLAAILAQPSQDALRQAQAVVLEGVRHQLAYPERTVNVPTLPLLFLELANRSRFFFSKQAEIPVDGRESWQVGYEERATPTVFVGRGSKNLPAAGTFWIAPDSGAVLRATLRLTLEVNLDQADVEITVDYAPRPELGGEWAPSEMRETYTTASTKLACVARYSKYRRLVAPGTL